MKKTLARSLPKVKAHPLKERIEAANIPLWQLRLALGGSPSEAKLSRLLNGIDKMPPAIEKRITAVLFRSNN